MNFNRPLKFAATLIFGAVIVAPFVLMFSHDAAQKQENLQYSVWHDSGGQPGLFTAPSGLCMHPR